MKYNFTNPYLSALERQQRALGLMPGSQNEIPKLGSLSSLNDSLNITTPGTVSYTHLTLPTKRIV